MDCGASRSLLKQSRLSSDQEALLAAHLASCAACADDEADAIGQLLRHAHLSAVHPSPTLTATIMARLPQVAPGVLYAREQQQERWRQLLSGLGLVLASVIVVLVSLWQGVTTRSSAAILAGWGGRTSAFAHFLLRLILVSKSVLQGSTPLVALLLMLVVLTGVVVQRLPRLWLPRAVVTTVLGLGLVVAVLARYPTSGSSSVLQGGRHSVQAPITVVTGAAGDVLSLFGDIRVQGYIQGDVATLGGKVILTPGSIVDGSVLSGAGSVQTTGAQIVGGVIDGLGPVPALAEVAPGSNNAAQGGLTRLGGMLGALVTLLLAGLWLMLQGERLCSASEQLQRAPLKVLGLGLAATLVLGTLCLAISTILAATLFGTVLIPLVLLVVHLPYIQGIAIVGQALGHRIAGSDEPVHGLWGIGMQAVVVISLAFVAPIASLVTFYLLGSLGLGAALFTSRHSQISF
ncbi:MAG: hypothetical protein H0X37_21080 [Herpetosiphonaceae bacterium]|nr:hypothetical protein [Herpetosiphonaceae bacterium]